MDNNNDIRKLGYSNELFFYTLVGLNTFNIQFQYDFHDDIDIECMKSAVRESIIFYPEFKIRVFRMDGQFFSERNDDPVPFFQGIGDEHLIGSDETNGYLFYIAYDKRSLVISYFHGLSDARGILSFMSSVLFLYARNIGKPLTREEAEELKGKIRLCKEDALEIDDSRYDPYGFYADHDVIPEGWYQSPGAAAFTAEQYPEESRELNRYTVELSLSEFLGITKQYSISVTSLLICIASKAFYQAGDIDKNKPVIAMLPVDMRKLFGEDTMVNFSDGILVPLMYDDFSQPLDKVGLKVKAHVNSQISRENFTKVITDKVDLIKALENSKEDMGKIIEHNMSLPGPEDFQPFSYAITYPGNLNMGTGLDKMISDMHLHSYARACSLVGYTYNNNLRLNIDCRSDNGYWAENIVKYLRELGISVNVKSLGRVRGDEEAIL